MDDQWSVSSPKLAPSPLSGAHGPQSMVPLPLCYGAIYCLSLLAGTLSLSLPPTMCESDGVPSSLVDAGEGRHASLRVVSGPPGWASGRSSYRCWTTNGVMVTRLFGLVLGFSGQIMRGRSGYSSFVCFSVSYVLAARIPCHLQGPVAGRTAVFMHATSHLALELTLSFARVRMLS